MQKLVVHLDDDPFITGLSAGLLRQRGITVVQRIRGDLIFDILRRFNPGVVIIEPEIHRHDSLELLAAIRSINPAMQVIVLTRRISTDWMLACFQQGVADFLTKPVENQGQLVRAVELCFDRLQLWRSRYASVFGLESFSQHVDETTYPQARELLFEPIEIPAPTS